LDDTFSNRLKVHQHLADNANSWERWLLSPFGAVQQHGQENMIFPAVVVAQAVKTMLMSCCCMQSFNALHVVLAAVHLL
jgi:hypothetical protein